MAHQPGGPRHYGNCCPGDHPPKGRLFGKYDGIFYVPAHVKGNPRHGIRVNDYEVA